MVVWGSFYVGFYKYARPCFLSDWIVVFNVYGGASYESQIVVEAIADAAQQAPIFLSRWETSDYVPSIQLQTGVNKNLSSIIIQVIIPDRTHPEYADTTGSDNMFYSNTQLLIIQGDNFNDEDELSLISDMRRYNICGNNERANLSVLESSDKRGGDINITWGAW